MDNILESMFLLELERLETKNCLACSTATLTDDGTTPQDLSIDHSCYYHNKTTVEQYRFAYLAIFNLKYMDLINETEFQQLINWIQSRNWIQNETVFYDPELCDCEFCGFF
jgi:hypothetical protein